MEKRFMVICIRLVSQSYAHNLMFCVKSRNQSILLYGVALIDCILRGVSPDISIHHFVMENAFKIFKEHDDFAAIQ